MTSAELLARLRAHVGVFVRRCSLCDPPRAVYCPRAEPDAIRLAERRSDEVYAERLARRVGR